MPAAAQVKFAAAGIDISKLRTTGDAAYFSGEISAFCRGGSPAEVLFESDADLADGVVGIPGSGETPSDLAAPISDTDISNKGSLPTITGIFRGKDNYVFEIDRKTQKAGQWRKDLKDNLTPGWGTDGLPVYRAKAFSRTFGEVILVFYVPKGKRAVSYLIIAGRPLRSSEALHAFAFHHRIEDFWKLLKDTLKPGAMHLRDRNGAHACVGIKVIAYLVVNMMKQNLRKLGRFRKVTINQLVRLCPKFTDVRRIFKEHFQSIIPDNHTLDKALA